MVKGKYIKTEYDATPDLTSHIMKIWKEKGECSPPPLLMDAIVGRCSVKSAGNDLPTRPVPLAGEHFLSKHPTYYIPLE